MAANEVHVGDVGTVLEVTVKDGDDVVDLSSATSKQIILQAPKTDPVTKDASFSTDGTDGKIRYVTVAGDLHRDGRWRIQALVTLSGGTWRTDQGSFYVYKNLE